MIQPPCEERAGNIPAREVGELPGPGATTRRAPSSWRHTSEYRYTGTYFRIQDHRYTGKYFRIQVHGDILYRIQVHRVGDKLQNTGTRGHTTEYRYTETYYRKQVKGDILQNTGTRGHTCVLQSTGTLGHTTEYRYTREQCHGISVCIAYYNPEQF